MLGIIALALFVGIVIGVFGCLMYLIWLFMTGGRRQ